MADDPFYKTHWRDIEPERMSVYRNGFGWDETTERLFARADITTGHAIADFGCGPGKVSTVLAESVGPTGHIHEIDTSAEFLSIARENAAAAGVSECMTTHLNDGASIPLPDAALEQVTARNTIMYVDEPASTLKEYLGILRQGGLAHAIDGDWFMMVAEPVELNDWRAFVKAASHACRHADMGRTLYGAFVKAGFQDIEVTVVANADVDGRLPGMIRNMAKYARESGTSDDRQIDRVMAEMETAHSNGSYLVVSPQFVVTGRKSG